MSTKKHPGRPPDPNTVPRKSRTFKVFEALYRECQEAAHVERVTLTSVIENHLRAWVEAQGAWTPDEAYSGETGRTPVGFALDEALYQQARAYSILTKISVTSLVEEALDLFLAESMRRRGRTRRYPATDE